jgi:hypothetical protein
MTQYQIYGDKLAIDCGQKLAEAVGAKGQSGLLKESFGITYKEAGQTTSSNPGAFANLLSTTLYTAAIEKIEKVLDLVDENTELMGSQGFGAIQLPRLAPTIAYEVSEGSVVNYFDEGITPVTVTSRKIVAGTSITWEIYKRGLNGFAGYILKEAADAIRRKLASDIVNGLAAGAATTPVTTAAITVANVFTAESRVNDAEYDNGVKFGFIADSLVITPTDFNTLRNDDKVWNSMHYASAIPGRPVNAAALPLMFGNLEVVVTPFLTSARALVLEKKRNVLVKEADLETFEGHIPGRPYDREVVALMSYVLAMVQPHSVCAITTN